MTENDLFQKLELIREQLQITITEFAPMVGMGQTAYYSWRRGAIPKAAEIAVKIINLLNKHN